MRRLFQSMGLMVNRWGASEGKGRDAVGSGFRGKG